MSDTVTSEDPRQPSETEDHSPATAVEADGERRVTMIALAIAGVVLLGVIYMLAKNFSGVILFVQYVADRPGEILARAWEHTQLVLSAIITAVLFSVPLGVAIVNIRPARNVALAIAGVLLTVPSLAFFAILIPLVGIGFGPPYIALTVYSILPILRNTITGLDAVDGAVLESAKGMGLNRLQRILRVQLPLAWPVILTGIRVAAVLSISIAAIAILVRGGGLGAFIQNGLTRNGFPGATESMWTGTLFTILLALIFERFFALVSRLTTSKGLQ